MDLIVEIFGFDFISRFRKLNTEKLGISLLEEKDLYKREQALFDNTERYEIGSTNEVDVIIDVTSEEGWMELKEWLEDESC